MKNPFIIRILIVLLALSLPLLTSCKQQNKPNSQTAQNYTQEITPEIKEIIKQKTEILNTLFQNQHLIDTIIKSNNKTQNLNLKEMKKINDDWSNLDEHSPKVMGYSLNNCGEILKTFITQHPDFVEIFITNIHGLNVCQTNKITLFCNKHEPWWEKAFNNGKGKTLSGDIRFEKSVGKITIPIYIPIFNPQTNSVIGICNAAISLDSIKKSL